MTQATTHPDPFENVDCLFCGSDCPKSRILEAKDLLHKMPGTFSLTRCTGCRLVFLDPRPIESAIHAFYPDSAGYYQPPADEEGGGGLKRKLSDLIFANYFGYQNLAHSSFILKAALFPLYVLMFRDLSIPKYKKDGRLLEIGCSHGFKLQKDRRRGWNVTGVEFNAKAAQWGREHYQLDIRSGSIFEQDFEAESFDAIRMDMVLEHIHQPDELIKRVTRWLKPGGELLFSIPYFEGLEFSLFRKFCYGLQLPTHLYFFNRTHLKRLLGGYQGLEFRFHRVARDFTTSFALMNREHPSRLSAFLAKNRAMTWLVFKPAVTLLAWIGKSSRVTVRAVKS